MTGNPYGRAATNPYQGQAVQTATPAQLVLMLYDGALTAIGRVRIAERDRPADAIAVINKELQRTQAIVNELQVCLNHEKGSPIAGYFAALYDFCQHELLDMSISKVLGKLDDVETVIRELREAWNEACVKRDPLAGQVQEQQAVAV